MLSEDPPKLRRAKTRLRKNCRLIVRNPIIRAGSEKSLDSASHLTRLLGAIWDPTPGLLINGSSASCPSQLDRISSRGLQEPPAAACASSFVSALASRDGFPSVCTSVCSIHGGRG